MKLKGHDAQLARAAEVANRTRQVREIERDLDGLADEIPEPWDGTTSG